MKILVIEDEPSVADLISFLLSGPGREVIVASLIYPIDFSSYDAVLADYRLIGFPKNGEELLEECSLCNPDAIRVLVTGIPEKIQCGTHVGRLVKKPFSRKDLFISLGIIKS